MVLAAGRGERFGSLREKIPKPMARIGGKPILERVLEHLRSHGIREVVVNLHNLPEVITAYFGDGSRWGMFISYSFEPELLGTAGAVRRAAERLSDVFLVYYGDNLVGCDLGGVRDYHRLKNGIGTIVVAPSYDDIPGGIVERDGEGRLTAFREKPPGELTGRRWENGGVYVLDRRILAYIPERGASDFARDVFPAALAAGERIYCYEAEGDVRGIDTPERYARVSREMKEGRLKLR